MPPLEQTIGKRFLSLLKERTKPLIVRAFGSRLRGDALQDSDFDVVVVIEIVDAALDKFISECAWEAGFEYGVIVSPLVYSRADYEREAASPLLRAIEREGETLLNETLYDKTSQGETTP
ncbi:MAG: nucleotidyltransferase domain-containing protein [Candidatus Kapaibacterium sp.]|nr:MAG: nucleotidyltransferase domain-containing protein [Candidatus Kapabacteria bacterium]